MALPDTGFVRLPDIIGCRKRNIPAVIPVSRATWFRGVASGRFPASVSTLGPGIAAWKVEDIRALVAELGQGVAA